MTPLTGEQETLLERLTIAAESITRQLDDLGRPRLVAPGPTDADGEPLEGPGLTEGIEGGAIRIRFLSEVTDDVLLEQTTTLPGGIGPANLAYAGQNIRIMVDGVLPPPE